MISPSCLLSILPAFGIDPFFRHTYLYFLKTVSRQLLHRRPNIYTTAIMKFTLIAAALAATTAADFVCNAYSQMRMYLISNPKLRSS